MRSQQKIAFGGIDRSERCRGSSVAQRLVGPQAGRAAIQKKAPNVAKGSQMQYRCNALVDMGLNAMFGGRDANKRSHFPGGLAEHPARPILAGEGQAPNVCWRLNS
jgi:hypothetical protein